jgi:uncharacterized protein YggE
VNIRLFAAIALLAGSTAAAQTPTPFPRIVTSGEGQVKATPDRATVFAGVQTRALTAAAAAADNARRQRAIIDTIKALGIPAAQIGTQNYSVSPEMRYDQNGGTPKVTGYVVTNTVRVELKNIEQIGSVIDASLAKGANEISGVQFGISTFAAVRRAAIADAVQNARADADALAAAAGGSVGPLLEISSSAPSIPRPMMEALSSAKMAGVAPTPIEPGEQTVTASVSVTWQFVPRPPR